MLRDMVSRCMHAGAKRPAASPPAATGPGVRLPPGPQSAPPAWRRPLGSVRASAARGEADAPERPAFPRLVNKRKRRPLQGYRREESGGQLSAAAVARVKG